MAFNSSGFAENLKSCPTCNGRKTINVDGVFKICPTCQGTGALKVPVISEVDFTVDTPPLNQADVVRNVNRPTNTNKNPIWESTPDFISPSPSGFVDSRDQDFPPPCRKK